MQKKRAAEGMTKERLCQYRKLKNEIKIVEQQMMSQRRVHDTVRGSTASFPYIEATVSVYGYDVHVTERLRARRMRLNKERMAIERYIDSITDSYIRCIISLRYVDGLSWAKVAEKVDGNNSRESVRKAADRYISKG